MEGEDVADGEELVEGVDGCGVAQSELRDVVEEANDHAHALSQHRYLAAHVTVAAASEQERGCGGRWDGRGRRRVMAG